MFEPIKKINSYLENYQESIEDLKLMNKYIKEKIFSSELYSSFSLDDIYRENTDQLNKIEQYVEKISSLIKNKCNIKDILFLKIIWGKQNPIMNLFDENNNNNNNNNNNDNECNSTNEINESDSNNKNNNNDINNKSNNTHDINIEQIMISSLKPGLNKMKYMRLRVISEISTAFGFSRSCIAVDETNNYIALSIYNLKNDIPLIGKEIIVYEPIFNTIKVKYDKEFIKYDTIRINLYSQKSLKLNIEKESQCLEFDLSIDDYENKNVKKENKFTLNNLKNINLIINNEFLDEVNDIEYSKIHFDYSS
eukprot:jgi/Orpsp1_1/1180104/evm.model.c7180000072184.1